MKSLTIGKIAGIRILMHWTFLLLLGWIVFSEIGKGSDTRTILFTVLFVLAIFACVVLHELGHSLMAKRYGIDTKKITLLPIGGLATLERMPDEPKQELWIALAGPAVNVVIAFILFFFVPFEQLWDQEEVNTAISDQNWLVALFSVNVLLVLFNAIPAFPMDGGRVLRSLLALRMDKVKATQIAASLGKFFAIAFAFIGLFYNPFLILIGVFIYFGAHSENIIVQHLDLMKGYTVRDAMMTNLTLLSPSETVKDATVKLLAGSEEDFVVSENGNIVGILTRDKLIQALQEKGHDAQVENVMDRDFGTFDVNEKLTTVYTHSQKARKFFFPVLENNKLAGVINRDNMNEFVLIRSNLHLH